MKKVILALILILLSNSAIAEWTQIGETNEFTLYVSFATIEKDGNLVKMWNLTNFKSQQTWKKINYLSIKSKSEYDCKEGRFRGLIETEFNENMGKGVIVNDINQPRPWKPIVLNTTGEDLWKIACGLK